MKLPERTLFEPMPPEEADEFSRQFAAFLATCPKGKDTVIEWRHYVGYYNARGERTDETPKA